MVVLRIDASNFMHFPVGLMNKFLCELAVNENPMVLQYVPTNMIDENLCVIAVKKNPDALQSVPDKYKTSEFYEKVIMKSGH